MKIRAGRRELADALAWVAGAISKKPNHPVLAGMRLTAADDRLTLQAFDYDTAHTAHVDVEVVTDGECLVSGLFVKEIVGALKGDQVELVLDGERLSIASGRATYRAAVLRIDEYPKMPAFPPHVGRVAYDDLVDVIGAVDHAVSRDASLAILTAINLRGSVGMLRAACTDRRRIARADTLWSIDGGTDDEPATFTANVPLTAVTAALKGMRGAIEIGASEGLFGLADADRMVTTRCLPDEFPSVDQYLDIDPVVTVEVDALELTEVCRRATLTGSEHDAVRLSVVGDEIAVTASSDTSDATEFVSCTSDRDVDLVFNGRYLADALTATDTTRIQIRLTGDPTKVKPVTLKPLDHERVDLLVMPRRNL